MRGAQRCAASSGSGALGWAEDTSDAAVACHHVGPIGFKEKIDKLIDGSPKSSEAVVAVPAEPPIPVKSVCVAINIYSVYGLNY